MKRVLVVLTVFAAIGMLLFTSSHLFAQARQLSCQERFALYDINGDGVITLPEYRARYNVGFYRGTQPVPSGATDAFAMFNQLDVGQTGYLTIQEFCAGEPY